MQLAAGLTPDDIRVTRDFDNLYLNIADTGDTLAINNWFTWGDAAKVEQVAFADADNTVWDAAQLEAFAATATGQGDFLIGADAGDTLQGLGGDDRLAGLTGDDILIGGAGNDTYYLNIGDGQDEIGDTSGIDTLAFGAGIAPDNVTLEFPSGADLLLRYGGYGDSVLIRGGLEGSIENISFADENISPGGSSYSIEQLVAMQYGIPDVAGIPSATPNPVPAELLHTGDYRDAIVGYSRDTTYLYDGAGKYDILDLGGYDTIQLGAGIAPEMVTVSYEEDPAEPQGPRFHVLVDGGIAFSIADGERGVIERYRFADGSEMTHQQMVDRSGGIEVAPPETVGKTINQYGPMIIGTDGNDAIYDGDIGRVTYIAGKGNDTLNVYVGNNCNYVFNLGDGSDVINSDMYNRNETIVFGEGITPESLSFGETQRTEFDPVAGIDVTTTDLTIRYGNLGDQVVVTDGAASNKIENFTFADGTTYSLEEMRYDSAMPGNQHVPGFDFGESSWQGTDGEDAYYSPTDVDLGGGRGYGLNDFVYGLGGNDRLLTGMGDDVVAGGAGNDTLDGGMGDDMVDGGADNDTLDGGDGADTLDGGSGNDTLTGGFGDGLSGFGNDVLQGGAGDDTYRFGRYSGIDLIGDFDATPGNTDTVMFAANVMSDQVLVTRSGEHLLLNIADTTDTLIIRNWFSGDDAKIERVVFESNGEVWDVAELAARATGIPGSESDMLYGTAAPDLLDGGDGVDMISGSSGNDIITGGAGDDILLGGAGNDTYVINPGDGVDTIFDDLAPGENTLRFGPGIDPQSIILGKGSLLLDLGNGDQVHIMGFDARDPYNTVSISRFEFDDGTVLTPAELLARGFDLDGADGDDTILGTNTNDRIDGGAGDDYMDGGPGDDTYKFGRGSGQDEIGEYDTTPGNTDTIRLEDLLPSDIRVTRDINNLYLNIPDTGDTLAIDNWYTLGDAAKVEQVAFADADNTVWDAAQLEALAATATGEDDFLFGSNAEDTLQGLGGDDRLAGMESDDILGGGDGYDTYLFELGDGRDTVTDTPDSTGNVIRFGAGIAAASIRFGLEDTGLRISYGTQGDSVLIKDFAPDGVTGDQVISRIEFADGGAGEYTINEWGNAGMDTYDAEGNLLCELWQDSDGYSESYTYGADGNLLGEAYLYSDGSSESHTYDAGGTLLGETHQDSAGSYSSYSYTYDADGNPGGRHLADKRQPRQRYLQRRRQRQRHVP